MCAYNSTRHSTTGFLPFMFWHGREKRIPLMSLFPKREKGFLNCKEYLQNTFRRSAKIQQIARVNAKEAQIRQKRNYEKDAVHMHPFKQGDEVLVSVKVIPRGGVGKLLRPWRGPCKVSEKLNQRMTSAAMAPLMQRRTLNFRSRCRDPTRGRSRDDTQVPQQEPSSDLLHDPCIHGKARGDGEDNATVPPRSGPCCTQ